MKKLYKFTLIAFTFLVIGITSKSFGQSVVTFYTTEGDFVVEMYDTLQPITAGNILKLVGEEYFDGIIFHRVIDNFVIQGGDPTGTGTGGPGYTIMDEFHPSLSNLQKTLSMANSGPNTGGSQFFVNLVNNTHLDYNKAPLTSKHPVFGIVTSGFNVVQNIGKVSVDGNNRPLVDVVMDSVRITSVFVGIDKRSSPLKKIQVYPNPVNSESRLTFFSEGNLQVNITLIDEMGKLIHESSTSTSSGLNRLVLNELVTFNKLSKGIYTLRLQGDNFATCKKLIVME